MDADSDDEEDDYEEPDLGSGTKKRRPKPPRGAMKKANLVPEPKQKVRKTAGAAKKLAAASRNNTITSTEGVTATRSVAKKKIAGSSGKK